MRLDRFLETRLAISRRSARGLLARGAVSVDGRPAADGAVAAPRFGRIEADGAVLQDTRALYLMLHKPRGVVSATRDARHRTVLDLVDLTGKDALHIAGRLDVNTTGLLLLTNDGAWSARVMHPDAKLPKTYLVETWEPISEDTAERFLQGLQLRPGEPPTRPAALRVLAPCRAELTLHEGRYHQVRRMFGAVGNGVRSLHRRAIGGIELDPALAPGAWRPLGPPEVALPSLSGG